MKIKIEEGKEHQGWRKAGICFIILFLITGIYLMLKGNEPYEELSKFITCSELRGTPAWIKDGEILDYGYKEEWKEIPDGVLFYYNPECYWCKKQIDLFGEEYFNELKEKEYAINCAE